MCDFALWVVQGVSTARQALSRYFVHGDSLFLCFPVPCPNLYVQLNGLTFTMDPVSLLWGNLFCLDLYRSLEQFKAIYTLENSSQKDEHLDVRLDAVWLKVGREWDFAPS